MNMKKLIIAAAALVTLTATVSAQDLPSPFSFGVKGGLNIAGLSNLDNGQDRESLNIKLRTAFYVGAFAEYKFNDSFGISPEFVYSSQGTKAEGNEWDYEYKLPLHYFNIPVLAKVYVTEAFSIDFGPQFGLLLSAKDNEKTTWADGIEEYETDFKGEGLIKTFDVGLGVGATYNIGKFMIQCRYNIGLVDVAKFEGENEKPSDHKAWRNNVFQLGVAFRF